MSNIYITIPDLIHLIDVQGTFKVYCIMEIGSMDGADMSLLYEYFKPSKAVVIEAHPTFSSKIADEYPEFEVYNLAASNTEGEVEFLAVTANSDNLGVSSLMDREDKYPIHETFFNEVLIDSLRMDNFCAERGIPSIDLLKIDVEGHAFEVLEGFGEMIHNIICIHVECEHESVWKGQKLYSDVEAYLIGKGFIPLAIRIGFPQSDSFWIKKEYLNPNWHL